MFQKYLTLDQCNSFSGELIRVLYVIVHASYYYYVSLTSGRRLASLAVSVVGLVNLAVLCVGLVNLAVLCCV